MKVVLNLKWELMSLGLVEISCPVFNEDKKSRRQDDSRLDGISQTAAK